MLRVAWPRDGTNGRYEEEGAPAGALLGTAPVHELHKLLNSAASTIYIQVACSHAFLPMYAPQMIQLVPVPLRDVCRR